MVHYHNIESTIQNFKVETSCQAHFLQTFEPLYIYYSNLVHFIKIITLPNQDSGCTTFTANYKNH